MSGVEYHGHPDQHFGHITYSQHGEDLMLLNLFKLLSIDKPSYLDLGAHHPINISNTKLLYDRGSRGVNVEANPNLFQAFVDQRPHDINLCIGVARQSGVLTFHMYDQSSGRNTFSETEVESLRGVMTVKTAMTIPVVTLKDIIDQHCGGKFPQLLSVDIEGFDFDVLDSTDFSKDWPIIIIVETRRNAADKMCFMLREKGFNLNCRMGENLIFTHSTHWLRCF